MISLSIDGYEPQINVVADVETYVQSLSGTTRKVTLQWPDVTDQAILKNIRQAITKSTNGFRDYQVTFNQLTNGVEVHFREAVAPEWIGVVVLRLYNMISWAVKLEVKLKSSKVFTTANFNALTTEQRFIK